MPNENLTPLVTGDEDFNINTSITTQVRLDGEKVKKLLEDLIEEEVRTEEQIQALYKEVSFPVIRTPRKDKDKKPPFQMPNLSNATIGGLVDLIGKTREEASNAKKLEGIYKTRLIAELNLQGAHLPVVEDSGDGGEEDGTAA